MNAGVQREGKGGHNSPGAESLWGRQKSQQCHKYFLQLCICIRKPQVQTWMRQTCVLHRAPSNLVKPLDERAWQPSQIFEILADILVRCSQRRTQGGLGLTPLELDILQKLYYLRKGD